MEERLKSLEQRMLAAEARAAAAEQTVRSLRRWGLVATAGAATLAGIAYPRGAAVAQNKPIKVTKVTAPFQVVDGRGRILMMVESGKPGPYLQVYDTAGKPVAVLGMGMRGGGHISLLDRAGKPAFAKP